MPSTKSQSPGPSPAPKTTSLPVRTTKTTVGSKAKETKNMPGRPGSAGGIRLEKNAGDSGKKKTAAKQPAGESTPVPPKLNTAKDVSEAPAVKAPATPAANRQRRRPRKLNKEPAVPEDKTPPPVAAPNKKLKDNSATTSTDTPSPLPATAELEALKSRVRGLEAKVEELYKSSGTGRRASDARSPRRRGKRKGSSASQVPTLSNPPMESGVIEELPDSDDDDGPADEELVRLEGELEVARRDLELYRPQSQGRPRNKRTTSADTEYIEEIPRREPGVGDKDGVTKGDRQVTLSGSYRIPLPSTVSMEDVKNIQSGVSAAQNVARSFLEQRRTNANQQGVQGAAEPKAKAAPRAKKQQKQPSSTLTTTAAAEEQDMGSEKQSWGEWFGGYSVAISRAVKNIEAEAAIESQRTGDPGTNKASQSTGKAGKPKGKTNAKPSAKQPLYE